MKFCEWTEQLGSDINFGISAVECDRSNYVTSNCVKTIPREPNSV